MNMVSVPARSSRRAIKTEGGRFDLETNYAIEMLHITKRFPGIIANDDITLQLKKGEILGVAGLVGAQRTELMEGIFGLRAHTSGKVWIKGEEVNIKQPRDAIRKSVALLTEDRRATGILGVLSVADNISIASLDALRKGPIMLDNKKILDLVATNKEKMAIKVPSPKTQIKSLSGGNQQKVLIARGLPTTPMCSFWTSLPAASTSVQSTRSTASLPTWPSRARASL